MLHSNAVGGGRVSDFPEKRYEDVRFNVSLANVMRGGRVSDFRKKALRNTWG